MTSLMALLTLFWKILKTAAMKKKLLLVHNNYTLIIYPATDYVLYMMRYIRVYAL